MAPHKPKSSNPESLAEFKNLIFASIISADNDEFTEEVKQEIIDRYNKYKDDDCWDYILSPIADKTSLKTVNFIADIMRS